MNDYIIFTDSCCDIKPGLLAKWGVSYANMTFTFDGDDREYTNEDISVKDFYDRMRQGETPKTAAINADTFRRAFEPFLKLGKDVLYVAFSSGLSTTINSAHMAAQELMEKYPERKILIVDTLSASVGVGLMVYLAVQKEQAGVSIDKNAAYLRSLTAHNCLWFTVDDLEYLKRGGRVNPAVAFVGGLLGIKPVLQMDDEGHLVNAVTARGRKKSIDLLADKYGELAYQDDETPVFISHSDCMEDAQRLAELLKQRYGVTVELIEDVGPVIGSHAGPGALALGFIGKHR